MTKRKNLFSIAHDHFHGLMLAQIIKKGGQVIDGMPSTIDEKVRFTLHFYDQELVNHFYIEENIMMPIVKGFTIKVDKQLSAMLDEHKQINELVKSLKEKENLKEKLDKIGKKLEAHVQMEEWILFPAIQDALDDEELSRLAKELKENGYENIYKY